MGGDMSVVNRPLFRLALALTEPQAYLLLDGIDAHARRKFYEARSSDALRAHQALAYYRQLYELESSARRNDFEDDRRLRMPRELALPMLERFRLWRDRPGSANLLNDRLLFVQIPSPRSLASLSDGVTLRPRPHAVRRTDTNVPVPSG